MRIGEAPAAEIRHGIGLAPDHIIQDPKAKVLQRDPQAEHIMVGAHHPNRAILAQNAPAFGQPGAGEGVIGGQIGEAIPGVIHAIHNAFIGPSQFALQLKVVGRVSKNRMHTRRRQAAQHGN